MTVIKEHDLLEVSWPNLKLQTTGTKTTKEHLIGVYLSL